MSNLIVRDLDDRILLRLKTLSKQRGLSTNRYLRQIIEQAVLAAKPAGDASQIHDPLAPRNDLSRYAGTWTKSEYAAFTKAAKDFEKIDPELWK